MGDMARRRAAGPDGEVNVTARSFPDPFCFPLQRQSVRHPQAVPLQAILGAEGAKTGDAKIVKWTIRVTVWGILAMAVTGGIGRLAG